MFRKQLLAPGIIPTVLLVFQASIVLANTNDSNDARDEPSEVSVYDPYSNVPYWINLAAVLDVTFDQWSQNNLIIRAGVGPKFLVHTKSKGVSVSFTPLLHFSYADAAWPGMYHRRSHTPFGSVRFDDVYFPVKSADSSAEGVGSTLAIGVEWHLSRVRWGLFAGLGVDHFIPSDILELYEPITLLNTFLGVEFWPPPLAPGFQMGISLGAVVAQIPLIEGTGNFNEKIYFITRLSLTLLFDIHKMREDAAKNVINKEAR